MRTTIDIDDKLIADVMAMSGLPTKKATVEAALKVLLQQYRQKEAIANLAGIGWDANLDEMRRDR